MLTRGEICYSSTGCGGIPRAGLSPVVTLDNITGDVDYNSTNTIEITSTIAGTVTATSGSVQNVAIISGDNSPINTNGTVTITYKG